MVISNYLLQIFGLLALAKDGNQISIDYSKSFFEVYKDVKAVCALERYYQTMCRCQLSTPGLLID